MSRTRMATVTGPAGTWPVTVTALHAALPSQIWVADPVAAVHAPPPDGHAPVLTYRLYRRTRPRNPLTYDCDEAAPPIVIDWGG